jgi:hypothetical protein
VGIQTTPVASTTPVVGASLVVSKGTPNTYATGKLVPFDALSYGAAIDSATDDYASMNALVASLPSSTCSITLRAPDVNGVGAMLLGTSISLPKLHFTPGVRLKGTSSAVTVSLKSVPDAADDQWIFDVTTGATYEIKDATKSNATVSNRSFRPGRYPVGWFGATGDQSGPTNDFAAIQAAVFTAGAEGGRVVFENGSYVLATGTYNPCLIVPYGRVGMPVQAWESKGKTVLCTATSGLRMNVFVTNTCMPLVPVTYADSSTGLACLLGADTYLGGPPCIQLSTPVLVNLSAAKSFTLKQQVFVVTAGNFTQHGCSGGLGYLSGDATNGGAHAAFKQTYASNSVTWTFALDDGSSASVTVGEPSATSWQANHQYEACVVFDATTSGAVYGVVHDKTAGVFKTARATVSTSRSILQAPYELFYLGGYSDTTLAPSLDHKSGRVNLGSIVLTNRAQVVDTVTSGTGSQIATATLSGPTIIITTTASSGLATNDIITIPAGSYGMTGLAGTFQVTVSGANITLVGSSGSGTYTPSSASIVQRFRPTPGVYTPAGASWSTAGIQPSVNSILINWDRSYRAPDACQAVAVPSDGNTYASVVDAYYSAATSYTHALPLMPSGQSGVNSGQSLGLEMRNFRMTNLFWTVVGGQNFKFYDVVNTGSSWLQIGGQNNVYERCQFIANSTLPFAIGMQEGWASFKDCPASFISGAVPFLGNCANVVFDGAWPQGGLPKLYTLVMNAAGESSSLVAREALMDNEFDYNLTAGVLIAGGVNRFEWSGLNNLPSGFGPGFLLSQPANSTSCDMHITGTFKLAVGQRLVRIDPAGKPQSMVRVSMASGIGGARGVDLTNDHRYVTHDGEQSPYVWIAGAGSLGGGGNKSSDFEFGGAKEIIVVTANTTTTIHGMTPPPQGSSLSTRNLTRRIRKPIGSALVLANMSASETTSANKFLTGTGADLNVTGAFVDVTRREMGARWVGNIAYGPSSIGQTAAAGYDASGNLVGYFAATTSGTSGAKTSTITATTNAAGMTITAAGHGATTGDIVQVVTGVAKIDACSPAKCTVVDANTITIDNNTSPGVAFSGSGTLYVIHTTAGTTGVVPSWNTSSIGATTTDGGVTWTYIYPPCWEVVSLGGAGGSAGMVFDTTVYTSTFTPVAGKIYLVDTSGGAFSVTLPAGAADAQIGFVDHGKACSLNPLTINRAGSDKVTDWQDLTDGTSTSVRENGQTLLLQFAAGSVNTWTELA